MAKKICTIFVMIMLSCVSTSEIFGQQEKVGNQDINSVDAKKVAEKYLEFVKMKDYEGINNLMYVPTEQGQSKIEENGSFIEGIKIYNEELGDIISYKYKSSQWYKPIFEKHWDPGKTPFVNEPSNIIKEPASLTLIYEVQYSKDKSDTTIKIVEQNSELKVESFGINYPLSFKGMQKIMSIQKRAGELIKEKRYE